MQIFTMSKTIKLSSFKPAELNDVQLKYVAEYNPDTHRMEPPNTIGYYRQPDETEYPLNLGKGYENYIYRDWSQHNESPFVMVLRYLMQQENPKILMDQIDFCSNRYSIVRIMEQFLYMNCENLPLYGLSKDLEFAVVNFKGCVFLNACSSYDGVKNLRNTYAFKIRQYLFVDTPGSTPNTDAPVDENRQLYGTFLAKLGDLNLLYSGEITGVENTEPLGDLNDPKVLQQCHLSIAKVFYTPKKPHHIGQRNHSSQRNHSWQCNWRVKHWLLQAHLSGIHQYHVGIFNDDGLIYEPIDSVSRNQLDDMNGFNLTEYTQYFRHQLSEITNYIGDIDCPYTIHKFSLKGDTLTYHGKKKEKNTILTEEFIQFANKKIL